MPAAWAKLALLLANPSRAGEVCADCDDEEGGGRAAASGDSKRMFAGGVDTMEGKGKVKG
jgi:hypothetical protein